MAVHHIISLLLSLLPPSWMVAPIRELENIYLFISAITSQPPTIARTPSNIDMDMNMDIDIIRGKSNSSSKVSSRELLTHSDTSTTPYHERWRSKTTFWMRTFRNLSKVLNSPMHQLKNRQMLQSVR